MKVNAIMLKKLVSLIVIGMVVLALAAPRTVEGAVTCTVVTKALGPCMTYLKGTGATAPPANCCAGVRSLKAAAQTVADRRMACNCMKTAAQKTKSLNYKVAARLASQCGVRMSYSVNPNVNCNRYFS